MPQAGLTTIGYLESLQMLPWSWCQKQDFAELPHCGAALGLLLEHSTPMLFVAVGSPGSVGHLGGEQFGRWARWGGLLAVVALGLCLWWPAKPRAECPWGARSLLGCSMPRQPPGRPAGT